MELVSALGGLLRRASGWHALGIAFAFATLIVLAELNWWKPSDATALLLYPAALAAGFAAGSGLSWLVKSSVMELRSRREAKRRHTYLLEQLGMIGPAERAVLGAFLQTGLQRHPVAIADQQISNLRQRGLLIHEDGTYHRIPDSIWLHIKEHSKEFPVGVIPPPTGNEWMLR